MAKKNKSTQDQGIELLENPEVISEKIGKVEEYINDKQNRGIVFGIGGLIVAVILAVIFYRYYSANQKQEADTEITQAIFYFESDSLNKALNGDGNNYGFIKIIDEYGSTDAGNLANFYTGAIFLRLENYESAVRYLGDFSTSDDLMKARAASLKGDAQMELKDYTSAISSYSSAVGASTEKSELKPIYLMKLAVAQEANNKLADAKSSLEKIVNNHKKSSLHQDARKHKARLEGLLAK